jgi:hypothetical protein
MPACEDRLSADDRWAVALYASLLRLPGPEGKAPPALRAFATTGRMSDAELLGALGAAPDGSGGGLARVAAVRGRQEESAAVATAEIFSRVRAQVESARTLAAAGDVAAPSAALDAYMTFEQVERSVRAKDPALAAELEADFATLRARAAGGSAEQMAEIQERLDAGLEKAERARRRLAPLNLVQSFVIPLRRAGAFHRRRAPHL